MMQCSESFPIGDFWMECKNPASAIVRTFKHDATRGVCSHCALKIFNEDKTFIDRNQFEEMP